jgi:uncharacterized membrane protein YqjE
VSEPGNGGRPGLLTSLRRLVATALEIAQVRLELLAVELEQEKLRIFDGLAWAALALLLLGIGLTLAVGLLLLLFWEGYRLPALAVLCVLFLGSGVFVAHLARTRITNPGGNALPSTLDELARDREALVGKE